MRMLFTLWTPYVLACPLRQRTKTRVWQKKKTMCRMRMLPNLLPVARCRTCPPASQGRKGMGFHIEFHTLDGSSSSNTVLKHEGLQLARMNFRDECAAKTTRRQGRCSETFFWGRATPASQISPSSSLTSHSYWARGGGANHILKKMV